MNKVKDLSELLLGILILETLIKEKKELAEEYARNMTKKEVQEAYSKVKSSLANQD